MTAYFWELFGEVLLVLLLTWWLSEYGGDQIGAWWQVVRSRSIVIRFVWPFEGSWTAARSPAQVIDFAARRATVRRVMGGR